MINCYYPSSQTNITINPNSTVSITISSSPLTPFDRVIDALLKLKIDSTNCSYNSFNQNTISLKDSNNNTIDNCQLRYVDVYDDYILFFDVTKMFLNDHASSHTFYITNTSSSYFVINMSMSFVELNAITPFETMKHHKLINIDIGNNWKCNIEPISFYHYLYKPLFNNIFKYPYSLIYDAYNPESTFKFFPKGWKLNILERIYEEDDELYYEDSLFNKRRFNSVNNNIFIDTSKTGLLIEVLGNNAGYKLHHPLVDSYKLFNADGYITKIVEENQLETTISYTTTTITITDSNNNVITITKSTNTIEINTVIGSETIFFGHIPEQRDIEINYTLNINSSNLLTSIIYDSFVKHEVLNNMYQTNTDSFTYDSVTLRLSSLTTFDNYQLLIDIDDSSFEWQIKYNNNLVNHYSIERFYNHIIERNELKDIETIIYFNDNGEILYEGEYPIEFSNGSFINIPEELKRTRYEFNINKSTKIVRNNIGDGFVFNLNSNNLIDQPDPIYSLITSVDANSLYLLSVHTNITNRLFPTKHNDERYFRVYLESEYPGGNPLMEFDIEGEGTKSIVFYNASASNNFKVVFTVKGNSGVFAANDVYLFKIDPKGSSIIYKNSIALPRSINYELNGYTGVNSVKYQDAILHEDDIKTNQLLYFKYGNTSYFYTDDLANIIINNNNIQVKINNSSTAVSFSSIDFGYLNIENNIRNVSFVSSYEIENETEPHYKTENYVIKGEYVFSYEAINDFHGNVISEDKIIKINDNYNEIKIRKEYSYDLLLNVEKIDVESLNNNLKFYSHEYDYGSDTRLDEETYHVGNAEVSKSYSYASNFEILESETDENEVTTTYTYSRHYEYLSKASKSSHYIGNNLDKGLNLTGVSHSSSFDLSLFRFGYDSKNRLNKIYYQCIDDNGIGGGVFNNIPSPIGGDEPNIIVDPFLPILVDKNLLIISRINLSNNGEQITYQYLNNVTFTETYDKYNHLLSTSTTGETYYHCSFTYVDPNDENGSVKGNARLSGIVDYYSGSLVTTSFSYDDNNQISSIGTTGYYRDFTINYTYDDYKNLIQETEISILFTNYSLVSKTYIRDYLTNDVKGVGNIISLLNGFNLITYSLNETRIIDYLSRPVSIKTKIGNTSLVGYDIEYYTSAVSPHPTSNQIKQITYVDNSSILYSYYDTGNIKRNGSVYYAYDDNGQLIKEGGFAFNNTFIYNYDNYGNITSVQYKDFNQTTTLKTFEYKTGRPNLLIKYNNEDIDFDNMLNPLNLDGATLTYIRANMLSTYSKNNITSSYFYNYEGIRTKKIVNGVTHHYLLNGHNIVREYIVNGSTTNETIYIYGISGIIGFIYETTLYLYEKDIFNNINKIYQVGNNNSLTLVAKYNYDAYGNTTVLNPDGTENTSSSFIGHINPFRYRSYYYDEESGYYYCNHRYYVPFIYRWLTMDDLSYLDSSSINGINLFAYCKNNPVMYVDPEGRDWNSFWNSIGSWFKKTFSGFANIVKRTADACYDYFFFGYEIGTMVAKIFGDDSKPISFFATNASEWWRFWEYKIGIKINVNDFHFALGFGPGEINFNCGYKNVDVNFFAGIDKIGFEILVEKDHTISYQQLYIRSIPVALLILACIYAPYLLPLAGLAFAG